MTTHYCACGTLIAADIRKCDVCVCQICEGTGYCTEQQSDGWIIEVPCECRGTDDELRSDYHRQLGAA